MLFKYVAFLVYLHDDVIGLYVAVFQGISFKSAKKKKGMVVGFVSFESAEQVNSALKVPFPSTDISESP